MKIFQTKPLKTIGFSLLFLLLLCGTSFGASINTVNQGINWSPMGLPDLRFTTVSANPTAVSPGGSVSTTANLKNSGNGYAGSSTVKYFLSRDPYLSSGDHFLGQISTGGLNSWASRNIYKTLTIPGWAGSGNWCILFIADANYQVSESNESNNISAKEITVQSCQVPAIPGNISGPATQCFDRPAFFSVPSVYGATSYVWTVDNAVLTNETSRWITLYEAPGWHTVCVKAKNSCGVSAQKCTTFRVITGGNCNNIEIQRVAAQEENAMRNDFDFYPNPAHNSITLTSGFEGEETARILSVDGKLMKEFLVNSTEMTVDIVELPAGIYFLNVIRPDGVVSKKLLKKG